MKLVRRSYGLIAAITLSTLCSNARAENFCQKWAAYMWEFDQKVESTPDSTWTELNAMNQRLHKGRRIAAVGQVSKAEAVPFPGVPSAVESELDPQTQLRVRGLYERYVILGRRIEDMWKDKFKNTESPTSMQRFASERDGIVNEMNKIAHLAKGELERYGLRSRDCFDEFEAFARTQVSNLNQALASANATLKMDDGVWVHAYDDSAPGAVKVEQVSVRKPASGEPAVVSEDN